MDEQRVGVSAQDIETDQGYYQHHGNGVILALEGCWDGSESIGLGLFPEILKSEFHGIRSVIEAHSRSGSPEGAEAGNANGILFSEKGSPPINLRVTSGDGVARYKIDRWD